MQRSVQFQRRPGADVNLALPSWEVVGLLSRVRHVRNLADSVTRYAATEFR